VWDERKYQKGRGVETGTKIERQKQQKEVNGISPKERLPTINQYMLVSLRADVHCRKPKREFVH
jgi:hypothetical protein